MATPISYKLFVTLLSVIESLGALFNDKLSLRRLGLKKWNDNISRIKESSQGDLVWCHCSSLGEYEQAIPVLQYIKEQNSEIVIVVSFYSASGYEYAKPACWLDHKVYLPVDTSYNANEFVKLLKPSVVLWTKYDFWFNYFEKLSTNKIPVVLFSAAFRKDQYLFKSYGRSYFKRLLDLDSVYVQDQRSMDLMLEHNATNVKLSGDTRIDRVMDRVLNANSEDIIKQFMQSRDTIVLASTHEQDFPVIMRVIDQTNNFNYVIFPHEVGEKEVNDLVSKINRPVIKWSDKVIDSTNIMVVDTIGELFSAYQYASIAYVGGGFGKSIHNILEPTVFGVPVIIGPAFDKFKEARDLDALRLIYTIDHAEDVVSVINSLTKSKRIEIKKGLKEFYNKHKGATQQVGAHVLSLLNNK